jgi:putative transposase
MKKLKFTDSQIMEALTRAESRIAVPEICREMGISTATLCNWRGKCGGADMLLMGSTSVMRLSDGIALNGHSAL